MLESASGESQKLSPQMGVPELLQRFPFNLPDSFPGHTEDLAHLF